MSSNKIPQCATLYFLFQVFSEKMGLEAGWNCHISLLSDSTEKKVKSLSATEFYDTHHTMRRRRHSFQLVVRSIKRHSDTPPSSKNRRRSAPGALNLDDAQVKCKYLCHKIDTKNSVHSRKLYKNIISLLNVLTFILFIGTS